MENAPPPRSLWNFSENSSVLVKHHLSLIFTFFSWFLPCDNPEKTDSSSSAYFALRWSLVITAFAFYKNENAITIASPIIKASFNQYAQHRIIY